LLKNSRNKYAKLDNFIAHTAAVDIFGPAARRRRPKLTGAPPTPTQRRRRKALFEINGA